MESVGTQAFDNCVTLSKIIFCGKNEAAFSGFAFSNVNTKFIFVSRELSIDKLGGLNAVRVIDNDCQIPTAAFTAAAEYLSQGTTCLSVLMSSTDEC